MGERSSRKRGGSEKKKRRSSRASSSASDDASSASDHSKTDTEEEEEIERKSRRRKHHRRKRKRNHRREREGKHHTSVDDDDDGESDDGRERRKRKKKRRENDERRSKKNGNNNRRKRSHTSSEDVEDHAIPIANDGTDSPGAVVESILTKFPHVSGELKQLLKMIDDGQAVDVEDLSDRTFLKLLKKLFRSLNLKKSGNGLYLLPEGARPCLEAVGPCLEILTGNSDQHINYPKIETYAKEVTVDETAHGSTDANGIEASDPRAGSPSTTKQRVIGPAMPTAEMLAAAARLTEAEEALREAESALENEVLIGPPPPAAVMEAESANDAERYEEVTRIMSLDASNPYEVLGLNKGASAEAMKKRYWKLSLLVHPDKCSHPQAHQAFTTLNQALKDLQDPVKREDIDAYILRKEEKEEFEAHMNALREAAQWRQARGEPLPGDDELLAEVKKVPVRDEWMTTLPPERKGGVSMHSTFFSKSEKTGRGDTSVWTDTPVERAQKAKQQYLEAYNQASLTAGDGSISEREKEHHHASANLMDVYNKSKRSMSLVEKHQQEQKNKPKKVKKSESPKEEEWVGKHPWRPWNRETDLAAGRQPVKLDSDSMVKGLQSRFSSGSVERSFL